MKRPEERFEEALKAFNGKKYPEALLSLISLHKEGYQRKQILEILDEACFLPNEEEMRHNFRKNIECLKEYPFVLGNTSCEFDVLPFRLYMISETEFYVYHMESEQFVELYQFDTDTPFAFYSWPNDSALFLENELDYSHLCYLNDNVRKSESLAYDNHIYLFYWSVDELAKLLLVAPLKDLLEEQKFVFLFGEENRQMPINFKACFGIDYSLCTAKPLTVDEVKRIIFGWKIENVAGNTFLAGIMDFHPDLITIPDLMMHSFANFYHNQLEGRKVSEAISRLKKRPDSDPEKEFIQRLVFVDSKTKTDQLLQELNCVTGNQFLSELENIMAGKFQATAGEWLTGIYLTFSRCHKRMFNERMIPALFTYPHDDMFYLAGIQRETVDFYFELIQEFPYHKIIGLIREPVTQAGAVTNFMTQGHPNARNTKGEIQLDPFYCMAFGAILPKDFYFPLEHPLYEDIAVIRFEDLKLNPEATFASMAEFLNLPVTESMYQTTECGIPANGVNGSGKTFSGFDPAPVYKEYTEYLSVFDKYRIELLLKKLYEAYGYRMKYYDRQPFSDQEQAAMMALPFLCESISTSLSAERKKGSHDVAMSFIRAALSIKQTPFAVQGVEGQFVPLKWLRPKEGLLRETLYGEEHTEVINK